MTAKYKVSKKDISFLLENPWVELEDLHNLSSNGPIYDGIFDNEEDPPYKLLRMLKNPDYFSFTCKHLLNINLLPFQAVILKELWIRPFPMLIGSRGLGKSFIMGTYAILRALLDQGSKIVICGSGFRQAKLVFQYAENIWNTSPILRDICKGEHKNGVARDQDQWSIRVGKSIVYAIPLGDGCLSPFTLMTYDNCFGYISDEHNLNNLEQNIIKRDKKIWGNGNFNNSDEAYCNGIKPIKRIKTSQGYEFGATFNHKMKILRNQEIIWARTDEMKIGDHILIDRSYRWHNGDDDEVTVENAYVLGLMIGNGYWTNKYAMGFATSDNDLLKSLNSEIGKEFIPQDDYHFTMFSKDLRQEWIDFWNMKVCYAPDKYMPKKMLGASREKMTACLQGLFDTDGHVFKSDLKGGMSVVIGFTTTSKILIEQIQFILLHYGIISYVTSRVRDEKWHRCYELLITGEDMYKFYRQIGFRNERKKSKLEKAIAKKTRERSSEDLVPGVLEDLKKFMVGKRQKRGCSINSHLSLSYLKQLKNLTFKKAAQFAQAFGHIDDPFMERFKKLVNPDYYYDEITEIIDDKSLTYDVHIPETHEYCAGGFFSHNSKIRGFRATDIIMDEFASVDPNIYQNVIQGFAAVTSDPVENVKKLARNKLIKKYELDLDSDDYIKPNRQILSGTAYYQFNHFATYWKRWRSIIQSKGDPKRLQLLFPEGVEDGFNYEDYSIIRIPVKLIPEGYMDAKAVGKAKASSHIGNYMLEYGAVFVSDTNGFFKRSLIEGCVAKGDNIKPPVGPVEFSAQLNGNNKNKYIIAIDPASEADNFAVMVLELHENHKRIVYCWTTNKAKYNEVYKKKLTGENDFYVFCAKKIRELRYKFPAARIAMDEEGGGRAVAEALRDPKNLDDPSHQLILPIVEDDDEKPTDNIPGEHILELINFSRYEWVSEANHTLKKDLEDKTLLFPFYDTVSIGLAGIEDNILNREFDTLEECTIEIEELKDELATIVMTQTPNGNRDRWDTPETKLPGGKKGRQRKDRYTALLIANMAARGVQMKYIQPTHTFIGGFASQHAGGNSSGPLFSGPLWYTEEARKNNYW